MARPWLFDLYCGAGGATRGYQQAGFRVVGVDINPQPRYCGDEFVQADALEILASLAENAEPWPGAPPCHAAHLSPVCKRFSSATPKDRKQEHPNHIPAVRILARLSGYPYVIENVPRAPLRPDFKICGCVVGLPELERERWFEAPWYKQLDFRQPCYHATSPITVAGHGEPSGPRMARGEIAHKADWERAMGIDWMTRDELAQAIPPVYTEYIGRQLLNHLAAEAAS